MEIRKATAKDAEQISKLAKSLKFEQAKLQQGGFLVYTLNNKDYEKRANISNFFLVAVNHGEVLGFLMCYDSKTLIKMVENGDLKHEDGIVNFILKQEPLFVFGDQIGIKREYEKKGIGKFMMHELFKQMTRDKIKIMFVAILHKPFRNEASIHFCKSFGFKFVEEVRNADMNVWGIYKLNL